MKRHMKVRAEELSSFLDGARDANFDLELIVGKFRRSRKRENICCWKIDFIYFEIILLPEFSMFDLRFLLIISLHYC